MRKNNLRALIIVALVVAGLVVFPSARRALAGSYLAITEYAVRFIQVSPSALPSNCSGTNDCIVVSNVDDKAYHRNSSGTMVSLEGGGSGGSVSLTCGSGLTCSPSTITGTGSVSPDSTILATLTGTQTLTNKTLTAPVLGGTATGTYTLGGTPTLQVATATSTSNSASPLTLKPFSSSFSVGDLVDLDSGGNTKIAILPDPAFGDGAHILHFYGSATTYYYKPLIFDNAAYSTTWTFQMGSVGQINMPGSEIDFDDQSGAQVRAKITASGVYALHMGSTTGTPTSTAGTCVGGTQTVSVSGNDVSGIATITGTATGTASATCMTVTFATTWDSIPHCGLDPANAAAAALSGSGQLYANSASTTTGHFVITAGATALPAGTYLYAYSCLQ